MSFLSVVDDNPVQSVSRLASPGDIPVYTAPGVLRGGLFPRWRPIYTHRLEAGYITLNKPASSDVWGVVFSRSDPGTDNIIVLGAVNIPVGEDMVTMKFEDAMDPPWIAPEHNFYVWVVPPASPTGDPPEDLLIQLTSRKVR